jgi:hypothetical protein
LVEASAAIRQDPTKSDLAFLAKHFIQATLPHKNPGDVPVWERRNGNLTLSIRPGWNTRKRESYGYPYGTIPRLLLFWITTEALRTKSPRLELGHSLTTFMRELGLNPDNGGTGAKRSDARRLRDQMTRLFRAIIGFDVTVERGGQQGDAWLDMQVAPEGMLWWDIRQPDQNTLWGSWIEIGQKFFHAIIAAPVPMDMRALKALKRSPLALDLYAWATYTAYQTQKNGQPRFVAWQWLHEQFGAEYGRHRDFKSKAMAAFRKVQAVYPAFAAVVAPDGLRVLPCSPAITATPDIAK